MWTWLIYITILTFYVIGDPFLEKDEILTKDLPPKGFGEYYMTVRFLDECKSSTPIDKVNKNVFDITVTKFNTSSEHLTGIIQIPNSYLCTKGILTPSINRNGVKKTTLKRISASPCDDPVLSIPFKVVFHNEKTCFVKKGNYTIRNIDVNAVAHMIFGNNFIYERGDIMIEYFTKAGCTFCLQLVIDTKPLIKSKTRYKKSNPFSVFTQT